jgi:hypothetical protein
MASITKRTMTRRNMRDAKLRTKRQKRLRRDTAKAERKASK